MKRLSLDAYDKRTMYGLLTSAVVPRPIALVTTKGKSGVINVAPFSYFNIVTAEPARLQIVVGRDKKTGDYKDTAKNIIDTKSFVVQAVTEANLGDANRSAARLPHTKSELDITSFTPVETGFPVPYLKESPVAFECELDRQISFESSDMFIGRVVGIYVDETVFNEGKFAIEKAKFVGRLSGNRYTTIGDVMKLERP